MSEKKSSRTKAQKGIRVRILGESDPFSANGKSTGYYLDINGHAYLLDCGAPLFQALSVDEIKKIEGVFATHSHEDHKRWFTDLALYRYYCNSNGHLLKLITRDLIHEEFHKTSRAALERTLTPDSKKIIEIPYERFVKKVFIGSNPRYHIMPYKRNAEEGIVWRVVDEQGTILPPERAKVVIHPDANRPRMLFCDPRTGDWVEPESYYALGDQRFYLGESNKITDKEGDFHVEAFKGWHGPPTTAFKITTEKESILFSGDTVYNPSLWDDLCNTKYEMNLGPMSKAEFLSASVIYGDINDYIERTWSKERKTQSYKAYENTILFHEVAKLKSVVHTDYPVIAKSGYKDIIFTHTPDRMVTRHPMVRTGMCVRIIGKKYYDEIDGKLWKFSADCYMKHDDNCFVGYKNPRGTHKLVEEENGLLAVYPLKAATTGKTLMKIKLLQDVNGYYYPVRNGHDVYYTRPDGKVEYVKYSAKGSRGAVARNIRKGVLK